ncbi:magnesium chelatase subunit I [Nonlabens ulvanivorans]|nr:magnesium chelatase subunit I [Nonlabens ulvanivorans]
MEENKDQLQPEDNQPQSDQDTNSQPVHEAAQEQFVQIPDQESGSSAFVPDQPEVEEATQSDGLAFKNRLDLTDCLLQLLKLKSN